MLAATVTSPSCRICGVLSAVADRGGGASAAPTPPAPAATLRAGEGSQVKAGVKEAERAAAPSWRTRCGPWPVSGLKKAELQGPSKLQHRTDRHGESGRARGSEAPNAPHAPHAECATHATRRMHHILRHTRPFPAATLPRRSRRYPNTERCAAGFESGLTLGNL